MLPLRKSTGVMVERRKHTTTLSLWIQDHARDRDRPHRRRRGAGAELADEFGEVVVIGHGCTRVHRLTAHRPDGTQAGALISHPGRDRSQSLRWRSGAR